MTGLMSPLKISITSECGNIQYSSRPQKPSRLHPPDPVPSAVISSQNSNRPTKAEQFKKGMKRDPTHFKVFKDKKQFKSWQRHLFSTAASQDVKEVLDPHYTPSNPDDAVLFREKQIYMYSIADTIL